MNEFSLLWKKVPFIFLTPFLGNQISSGHFLALLSQCLASTVALRNHECETLKRFRFQCRSCFASQSCSSDIFAPLTWEKCWEACFTMRLLGISSSICVCVYHVRSSDTCCFSFTLFFNVWGRPADIQYTIHFFKLLPNHSEWGKIVRF